MACCMRCSKRMKICCGATAAIVILLVVILVILIFTVFKQKDPTVTLQSVKVKEASLVTFPIEAINVSLGILLTVENPNYGSFSYHNSTAYLNYRGKLLATAPLHEDTLPARGSLNISTTLNFYADDLMKLLDLVADFVEGVINFTSTTTLEGRVKVLNLFKKKATSSSFCDISVFVHDKKRILSEHPSCFPKLGQIQIHAMKVKRKGYFYHLSDSMFVKSAFYGFNKSWFLSVDASPLGERGQNDCSSGSRSQKILLGNSDNALTGLINDEKDEHDFVNPSDKAVKDDNVVCEDEMSKSVSSAKEKQKSTRKEDDTPEYDASVFRPGNDTIQREIEVMADPSLNATKEVIIESEVLKEHQHNEFNNNNATIGIGTESMKEASEPVRATNKQKKSKRSLIHDADVMQKKGKKRSSNSHETHLTSFRKDAEAYPSNIQGGVEEEVYEDGIVSKDISMSIPTLEKMEIGTDASLEGIPSKVKKSKKHNRTDVETKLQPSGVKEPKEPKQLNEDNLNIVLDQCNESKVGLTDRAEGRREVLQDDPKPMQLEECTPSEQNNNTEANIKESNVTPKPVDMNEMGEPVKSEKKKRRKRKDMDLDESTSRKECTPSKQNNTDANVNDLNVTSKVVLGIEKSEKKKRKTRKDKDSDVETTVGEDIGPTDASDSKIVIVKSLKSSDCNPASGDIGAEENPLNHTEVGIIQQAEMKGPVVSAIEKDDASGADNPGSLEQIETIANAEHVDKTRRKKSNKKQSTKSKSSSNMLTNDVNPASGDIGAEENPLNHTEVGIIQQAEMKGTVVSATEKDDASGADNPGYLEQIETIANAEHVDKTRRKKSNKKQSTKSKSSSNLLTNDVNDSQKPSPSSDIGTLASPNVSLFPSNTAEGIDNLAPVEANDAAKDSTFSCEEKDEKNLEASLEDDRVNVEQQSPSQQVQHRSHLDKMVPNVRKTKRDAKLSSQSNSDISSIREKGKPRASAPGKSMDLTEMEGTVVSATEKDDASGADNPGSLEQIETIANAEHVDKTRRKKSNKKQSTKSKSSSNLLTNDVNDSQKPSPSSDIGTLASPNVSLFPSNTAEGIDNLAPVEANDAAKDSTFSCEEKDEKNLEASLEDDRVNVEQQSPSQQVQHISHLDKMVPNVRKTKRDAKLSSQSNSDISSIREKGKPRANASGKSMDSADHLPISSPTMKGSKKVIHKKAGKSLVNNAREVKGKTNQKKSLLSGAIFKDDSSDTSKDADKVDMSDASTKSPSANSLLSDFSDGDISEDSHGGKRLESGEQNDFNGSMSSIKGKPIDHVFRSSSRYKKARITASQLEESESQPEFVPDSLAE
ncbi:hypothetical protein Ahy_B10g101749 [Arachis hypogaea]|uniref:Late embryogenesis abundant protein LEA-2 subgroup domain-containing protein n=1 Tax=Arachis hypogaea TaxID=3818 RepID=A0A444X094_ARAHY|nr:hypothetical protein Ahy_B10g101749 [Arachis hypogaea]